LSARNAEFVVRLIDGQTRSLPAVAELLGFSAQSALARAARGLAEASRNGGSKSLQDQGRRPILRREADRSRVGWAAIQWGDASNRPAMIVFA